MNVVLIGYRGTGKTTVGRVLAEKLGRPFYDADTYLEVKCGRTISDMVAMEGWAFFRQREKEVIEELASLDNCVIATGGGAVMNDENVTALRRHGQFILLTADIPTMVSRIRADNASHEQRPDLLGVDIIEETKTVLKERMPVYKNVANFIVDTTESTVEEVVATVGALVKESNIMERI